MLSKLLKLLKNPKKEYKNIIPYLKSRLFFTKKYIFEFIGNDKLSKPYPGHDILLKYIDFKDGFFVQGGGNDGLMVDPTYYLEKFRGWSGIMIEPLPIYKQCMKNRKKSKVYNYALVSSDFKKDTVQLIDCNAMTVIKGSINDRAEWIHAGEKAQSMKSSEITATARTLDHILETYFQENPQRKIDLLVLDLEGYELNALMGLNIHKYKPRYMLLEVHGKEKKIEIERYLGDTYTLIDNIIDSDHLYKLK